MEESSKRGGAYRVNVWTDPQKAFNRLRRCSGLVLILLDRPARSSDPARAALARNWRLLKGFAEASDTPIVRSSKLTRVEELSPLHAGRRSKDLHFIIAGRTQGSVLPIILEAALLGLKISIVHDAFQEGRFRRSASAPLNSLHPTGRPPLYLSTSEVLVHMLMPQDVDEPAREVKKLVIAALR